MPRNEPLRGGLPEASIRGSHTGPHVVLKFFVEFVSLEEFSKAQEACRKSIVPFFQHTLSLCWVMTNKSSLQPAQQFRHNRMNRVFSLSICSTSIFFLQHMFNNCLKISQRSPPPHIYRTFPQTYVLYFSDTC